MPTTISTTNLRSEATALWKLAWPVLIGQLATVGMAVADVAMTGHTQASELAAVSTGAAIWSIVLVTVMGTMMAMNTLVAHEVGAGSYQRIPHLVRQGLWKGLGVGLVAMVMANLCTLLFDHLQLAPASGPSKMCRSSARFPPPSPRASGKLRLCWWRARPAR